MAQRTSLRMGAAMAGCCLFTALVAAAPVASAVPSGPATTTPQTSSAVAPDGFTASGGISLQPVQAGGQRLPTSYFTLKAKAGSVLHESVVATNASTLPVSLTVSEVAGLTGETSGSVYANRQDAQSGAGPWVQPSLSQLSLAARASRVVAFTVRIPADADPGDHLAGVAFENNTAAVSKGQFQIKQITRSVVGVLVTLPHGTPFHPLLTSLGISDLGSTGVAAVHIGLGNDGQSLGKPRLTVQVSGPKNYDRTVTRTLDTLLPGSNVTYPLAWPDALPAGLYVMTATLTGAGKSATLTNRVRLGHAIAGVNQPLAAAPAAQSTAKSHAVLTAIIAAGIAGAFGLFVGLLFRRRRERVTRRPDQSPREDLAAGELHRAQN